MKNSPTIGNLYSKFTDITNAKQAFMFVRFLVKAKSDAFILKMRITVRGNYMFSKWTANMSSLLMLAHGVILHI